jgi:hypothetical protein
MAPDHHQDGDDGDNRRQPGKKDASAGTTAGAPQQVLSYRSAGTGAGEPRGLVNVGSLASRDLARIVASVLEADGIESHVFNENTQALGMHFSGFTQCQIHVPAGDAPRAAAIVRQLVEDPDAVEPADEGQAGPPLRGDEDAELVVVGRYDHPRSLQEAAAVLGSARINPYLPRLVARGERPPGTGDRFLLRAEVDDADRARSLLEDAREEAEADAHERNLVRCPKCNRLTGERIPRAWQVLVAFASFRPFPQPEAHCGPCRHRWKIEQ